MTELTVGELMWSGRRGRRAGVAGRGRASAANPLNKLARPHPATPARRRSRPLHGGSPTVSSIIQIIQIILWIILVAFQPC